MTLSTVSKVQQIEDGWRAEQIAFALERKKKKEANKENEQSVEQRLAYLEEEFKKLKEKIECVPR